MNNKREELIKSALLNKVSDGMDIYTADDILIVADITDAELQEFQDKIQDDIEQLASKKKR